MPRFEHLALLAAVTLVAACGKDPAAPPAAGDGSQEAAAGARPAAEAAPPVLDDEEVVRRVFEAASDGDTAALPEELSARISLARVAVVALHDQILERRSPTPGLPALLDALDALSRAEGGVDREALPAMVAAWRRWDAAQIATEAELVRSLSIANAALSLPGLPRPEGLQKIVEKADEIGAPPPMSGAGAGMDFLRYATLAAAGPDGQVTAEQTAAMKSAREAFDALHWPGGFGLMAAPFAEELLRADPTDLRGVVLYSAADDSYRASGDLLRAGLMQIERARGVWSGQPDLAAVRSAMTLAETGRRRIVDSGVHGREVFEACSVHAFSLQAAGEHAQAVLACDAALAESASVTAAEVAEVRRVRAVSLFRLGRHGESADTARAALAELAAVRETLDDEARAAIPELQELAARACLEAGRHDEALALLQELADGVARDAGKPWAQPDRRADALLLRARALALTGRAEEARQAVRAVLGEGRQAMRQLAFAADVLLEAGAVDDADQVVAQAEAALGPDRAALFGELRGRIAAARGDLDGARRAFREAIDHVTGGDTTVKSLSASRIFESWARVEEAAGDRERAAELFQTAANHLVEIGVDQELRRLLAEVERLRN